MKFSFLDAEVEKLVEDEIREGWRRVVVIGALSRAGQRNSGIGASWFSSVEACLRARRMLVLENEAIDLIRTRLSCSSAIVLLNTMYV